MSLRRSPTVVKLFRYSAASVVGVCVGTPILAVLYAATGNAILSNLISVTCGAIPNYLINRRWTWHQTGKNRLWGEVVPFWAMSVLGMIASMVAVAYADDRWGTTFAVTAANLTGFGLLWVAKFLVLDKLMWKVVHKMEPDVAIDEAEAGLVGALSLDGTDGEPPLPGGNGTDGADGAQEVAATRRLDD